MLFKADHFYLNTSSQHDGSPVVLLVIKRALQALYCGICDHRGDNQAVHWQFLVTLATPATEWPVGATAEFGWPLTQQLDEQPQASPAICQAEFMLGAFKCTILVLMCCTVLHVTAEPC